MARSETERGFIVYDEFPDKYGMNVKIQESSSAEEPRLWVFVETEDTYITGAAHLNIEMVDRLIHALEDWKRDNGSAE